MSSPIALLRKGIEKGDWEQVCDGFKQLTGENVCLPESATRDQDTKRLLSACREIESILAQVLPQEPEKPPRKPKVRRGRKPKGDSAAGHEKLVSEYILPSEKERLAERSPADLSTKKLACKECDKTFELPLWQVPRRVDHADDGEPRFVCDRCIGRKKK